MTKQVTLYFVTGNPNEKQTALAQKASARIRNASKFHEDDAVENCDFVMGEVPEKYLERFEKSEQFDAAKRLIVKTESKAKTKPESE